MVNMIKQRYGRKNLKDLNKEVIISQLADCLAQLITEKVEEKTPIDINKGFYVYITSSNTKCRGIKYFKAESLSGAENNLSDAVDYFINRCALQSKTLFVSLGYDYIYTESKSTGAEDLVILGDDCHTRENFKDIKRDYKDLSLGEQTLMQKVWEKHLRGYCKPGYGGNHPCDNGCPCDRCQYDYELNLAYHNELRSYGIDLKDWRY